MTTAHQSNHQLAQSIYKDVEAKIKLGISRAKACKDLGMSSANFNYNISEEQNAHLVKLFQNFIKTDQKRIREKIKTLVNEGMSLNAAMSQEGRHDLKSTFSEKELKELKEKSRSNIAKYGRGPKDTKEGDINRKYENVVKLMQAGFSLKYSCRNSNTNPAVLAKRLNPEQLSVLASLEQKYNEKLEGENAVEVYRISYLTEDQKQLLKDGEIQIAYLPNKESLEYVAQLIKEIFPSDPCKSIRKDNELQAYLYLMAGKKGFWKMADGAFEGIEIVNV